jgi:hypothetical protein
VLKRKFQAYQIQKNELIRLAAFDVLNEYAYERRVLKLRQRKAEGYHEQSLFTKVIVSLYHYRQLSIDEKRFTMVKIQMMNASLLRKSFKAFRDVASHLKLCS